MNKGIVIVAGGSGQRMGSSLPKQFLPLAGVPVLMHTVQSFFNYNQSLTIVLVLPSNQIQQWNNLLQEYNFNVKHSIVNGGNTRSDSVRNGLNALEEILGENSLVGVHDGVRPFISAAVIERCFQTAELKGNAIPAIPLKDSIREIDELSNKTADRSKFMAVQTPQVFMLGELLKVMNANPEDIATDEATLMEKAGYSINLVNGDEMNIKVTTPPDMVLGNAIFNYLSIKP